MVMLPPDVSGTLETVPVPGNAVELEAGPPSAAVAVAAVLFVALKSAAALADEPAPKLNTVPADCSRIGVLAKDDAMEPE